jgi:anthranilate synthase component 1
MTMIKKVPVIKTLLADLHTPLSVYLKLANGPRSYLLESFQGGEKWGRYSIIGLPTSEFITVTDGCLTHWQNQKILQQVKTDDPLTWIKEFQQQFDVAPIAELPFFNGGLVGYFGYDTIRYIEKRLQHSPNPDTIGVPDIFLLVSNELAIFDNLKGALHLIVNSDVDEHSQQQAKKQLAAMEQRLNQPLPAAKSETTTTVMVQEKDFKSNQTKDVYDQAINRIKQYIIDGDVMQVVYSQRLSVSYHHSPLALYRALRSINPSPYLYYFDFGDFHVVGSSPEILVRKAEQTITVRPIAGTRPRGKTLEEDLAFEKDLLADEKELAEHLMLIDLGRNDVGRVSQLGKVTLTEKMIIERYSHVMHIVSNVEGQLTPGMCAIDALRATLPAGTLSGAPKIRAMEIIDELETEKRGIYGGAVGYLGWNDHLDVAIAIRTAIIKDQQLYTQAGGGIVADSTPDAEWAETMNKARAIFKAVQQVQSHLEFEAIP